MIVICSAENNLEIRPDRPVNFLDLDYRRDLRVDILSSRDHDIISKAVAHEAHIFCLSCVESANDVVLARQTLKKARGHHCRIYAKIQSLKGLSNINEIIDQSDGIVIARGYLGLSLD
mmetsp:Transcript_14351/g.19451  ORF Transcript_14351/g.19451 Transcript_14351/m.19451 type:complete len:118 (-) Transcript_14351:38-391(-)|eukprot:CAMPEP_0185599634 /NCGR_PEP_ID=MMETSP0434-20130131/82835_1 /TAXON_ID=626734 ORGANISM="Favella taraikaensis, Strain Fe Narragansett Bay" /NCGR_SAMPLE_ID=MMETSP0434 /ASSEMBLY_ACC=CAM_ASM_000379 /LENGTH=117 /DNA_ID=CAMNT_0028229103 /DNA_START=189 /DNA_END=542 /DNA_ORIENTATION=-